MKTKPGTLKGRAVSIAKGGAFSRWLRSLSRSNNDDNVLPANTHSVIAAGGTALLMGVSLLLARRESTYRWSFVFLGALLWTAYGLRERLALLPAQFALFVLAILLHDLGTFGFYEKTFFGLQFDVYIHFLFGLVAGLIVYRALREKLGLSPRTLCWLAPLLVLGLGGIHELIECFSTLLLGPERGMLKLRPDDPFDTQADLFNNLLGAVIATTGCVIRTVYLAPRARRS